MMILKGEYAYDPCSHDKNQHLADRGESNTEFSLTRQRPDRSLNHKEYVSDGSIIPQIFRTDHEKLNWKERGAAYDPGSQKNLDRITDWGESKVQFNLTRQRPDRRDKIIFKQGEKSNGRLIDF